MSEEAIQQYGTTMRKKKVSIKIRLDWIIEDYINWANQAQNPEYSPPYQFTSNEGITYKFRLFLYPRGCNDQKYLAVKIKNDGSATNVDYEFKWRMVHYINSSQSKS